MWLKMEDKGFTKEDFDGKFGRLEITLKPNFGFEWETAPHQDKEIVVGKVIVAKLNYEQKNTQVIRGEYNSEEQLKEKGVERVECAIHVDIGNVGPTRELINEVTAMIRGSGFTVQTKPYSYGASKVADRHT